MGECVRCTASVMASWKGLARLACGVVVGLLGPLCGRVCGIGGDGVDVAGGAVWVVGALAFVIGELDKLGGCWWDE